MLCFETSLFSARVGDGEMTASYYETDFDLLLETGRLLRNIFIRKSSSLTASSTSFLLWSTGFVLIGRFLYYLSPYLFSRSYIFEKLVSLSPCSAGCCFFDLCSSIIEIPWFILSSSLLKTTNLLVSIRGRWPVGFWANFLSEALEMWCFLELKDLVLRGML